MSTSAYECLVIKDASLESDSASVRKKLLVQPGTVSELRGPSMSWGCPSPPLPPLRTSSNLRDALPPSVIEGKGKGGERGTGDRAKRGKTSPSGDPEGVAV